MLNDKKGFLIKANVLFDLGYIQYGLPVTIQTFAIFGGRYTSSHNLN